MSALPTPMSEAEAKQVTSRIKLLFGSVTESVEKIRSLIEQAESGEAWRVLGYASWTAYFTDEFSGSVAGLEKAMRGRVVAVLAEAGMSVRTIASVTDTSIGTAHNDVVQAGVQDLNTSVNTTGVDGKSYPRKATFLKSGKPDAQSTEDIGNAVPSVKPKSRRRAITDDYRDATYELQRAVDRLQRIHADDRFVANRDNLLAGGPRPFTEVVYLLQRLEYDLDGQEICSNCEARIVPTWDNWRDRHCETCGGGGRDG